MKSLILHLGTHKTGTSFIQATLRKNEKLLGSRGIRVVVGAESNRFLSGTEPGVIETDWMNDDYDRLVFSNENFLLADNPARRDLARGIRDTATGLGVRVTTIFYVRPAVEFIPAMWAQYVKVAGIRFGAQTLDDFIDDFEYESILESIEQFGHEGPTEVRPYVRSLLKRQSIFDDFFEAIGVRDWRGRLELPPASVNSTPSRRQIDLARTYNLTHASQTDQRDNHLVLLDSFLRTAEHVDPTPSVGATVTKTQLTRISDRYATMEAALTAGAVDSRAVLASRRATAPDHFSPKIPSDAVDQYLQNMAVLSAVSRIEKRLESVPPN